MALQIALWTARGRLLTRLDDRPLETSDAAIDRARDALGVPESDFRRGEVLARD
jgi:hypothetical protein